MKMEPAASPDKTGVTEGLTPAIIQHLERVFKDAIGDKTEMDLTDFKKVVPSKNMFFVERIFKIFDADESGTISLEEFIKMMKGSSQQSPEEKLRYLFKVYDQDDNGTIEFSELRKVIRESMKENGLAFSDTEIDELTRMLFKDADTDNSSTISFIEFREQIERRPGFMDNLTLSIERWLLPPVEPQRAKKFLSGWRPRKLNWEHISNNWTSVTFLLLFFIINVALFVSRCIEYMDNNVFVVLARACGQCLNFNCAFVLVLVLRQTLTWMRAHGFGEYLPIDQHLYYHKLTGCFIFGYSILHTIMHICNFATISGQDGIALHRLLFSTDLEIGWVNGSACVTGWVLLLVLTIMMISSMPFVRRHGKFEIFYYLHHLAMVFWLCLILHGPNFWKWFVVPAVFYLIETIRRIVRNLSSGKEAEIKHCVLLPSQVIQLVIKRPKNFYYQPGDYVYINIPSIAKYEWHPFTISSAPELEDVIWLHIRGVGEWTNSLYRFFARHDIEAVLMDELPQDLETRTSAVAPVEPKDTNSDESATPNVISARNSFVAPQAGQNHESIRMKNPLLRSVSEATGYGNHPLEIVVTSPSPTGTYIQNAASQIALEMDRSRDFGDRSRTSIGIGESTTPVSFQRSLNDYCGRTAQRRTSFTSTSTSRVVQKRNEEDARSISVRYQKASVSLNLQEPSEALNRSCSKPKRLSVRLSVADKRCPTVIVMKPVTEDDTGSNTSPEKASTEQEERDLEREGKTENVVYTDQKLTIYLDGSYGSPTRHIFQANHAVLIATGIGITPFASILRSIMYQYRESRQTCPECHHKWTKSLPASSVRLRKVDFFWLNPKQQSFEWFVSLLSQLENEQTRIREKERFVDIHMYITSVKNETDMEAAGLQMAMDLLYEKDKKDLITGLQSRTGHGRPDWKTVFNAIHAQKKGDVTVFFCGPTQLAKTLHTECNRLKFRFRKEIF